ncbi:DUF4192 domain-containing protein [Spongiactinospora sp. TRM90649]|uniref:DUF4192 domain-containing protein n=1 Tax=Spongiactinospora sp. TRM90649 TaxID=3031114 RepID=UPI0023F62DCC|nr:DUF4192 domain-containing protein [Spongiactinospora sp. TRM90649]MDF5758435.1 DUF4192 domain-containing protein [Spongiactinospora sp. TRM90649]
MTAVSEPATDQVPTITITSPADAVAIVPYLLGYHPSLSMVVIMIDGDTATAKGVLRFDLPQAAADADDHTTEAVGLLLRYGIGQVLLLGYGPGNRATPVVDAMRPALADAGIAVCEALRVADGRYWSYLCTNPSCCPAEGVAFDVSGSVPAATAVLAGMRALPDRASLVATLDPPSGFDRARGDRVMRQLCSQVRELDGEDRDWFSDGVEQVTASLDRMQAGEDLDVSTLAWLGVHLTSVAVRDIVLTRIADEDADTHVRLWTEVTRKAPAAFAAPPATLVAFAALSRGDGALARVALERALSADPGYTMALLITQAIDVGMTPAQMFATDWGGQADAITAQARQNTTYARPVLPEGW